MADALVCEVRVDLAPGISVDARFRLAAGTAVLFGHTGAGKTVTLRALAGLSRPACGLIRVGSETFFEGDEGGKPRRCLSPQARRVGYVSQHAMLFPHMSVRANLLAGAPQSEAAVDEAVIEALGIGPLWGRPAASLSGGERQRVAVARALARRPRLLLLDEPLSALHLPDRRRLARWLRGWASARGVPVVVVTHDPYEAVAMGDELILLEGGRTVAQGPPATLLAEQDEDGAT